VLDLRGTQDAYGRELQVTEVALVDEIAAAAELVMGKATGVPVAVVRGLDPGVLTDEPASVRSDLLDTAAGCAIGVVIAVAAVFACVLVVAGLATLVLRIAGADAPWGRVWPTFAYTSAPLVVCAVPCLGPYCGIYVAGVWWLVAAGIALGTSCRASVGRAIAAVVIPAVVVLGLVLGSAVLFVVMPAAAAVKAATVAGAAAAPPGPAPADGANDEGDLDVGADAPGDPDSEPMPEAGPDPQSEPPPDREVSP
jgi:hypothetical protein